MKVLVSSRAFLVRESTLISKATSSSIDHMSDHNQEALVSGGDEPDDKYQDRSRP